MEGSLGLSNWIKVLCDCAISVSELEVKERKPCCFRSACMGTSMKVISEVEVFLLLNFITRTRNKIRKLTLEV